ncbi:MAG: hypothetical protein INQ03_13070 [Candidatus Heimdallarchaeota archaeon]|nr:hypothetical protein [Candidatus Heimdallarchaeota archaeon]
MSNFSHKDLNNELKESLTQNVGLEQSIKRYESLIPEKIETYMSRYHCTAFETMTGFYISDYLITSDELPQYDENQRLDNIFYFLKLGKESSIEFVDSVLLIDKILSLLKTISIQFRQLSELGIDKEEIESIIIFEILNDFYNEVFNAHVEIDYRWLLSLIISLNTQKPVSDVYPFARSLFEFREMNNSNYYYISKILFENTHFSTNETDIIAKQTYNSQITGTHVIIFCSDGKNRHLGHSSIDTCIHTLNTDDFYEQLHQLPELQTINGAFPLDVMISKTVQKDGYSTKIFQLQRSFENISCLIIILSEILEDIHLTQLNNLINSILPQTKYLFTQQPKVAVTILSQWANFIHLSQTVEGATIKDLTSDVSRERDWTIGGIVCTEDDKVNFYSNVVNNRLLQAMIVELLEYLGNIHTFLTSFDKLKHIPFEVVPYEVLFRKKEGLRLFLLERVEKDLGSVLLKTKEQAVATYIVHQHDGINRKFTRMKLADLAKTNQAYDEWLSEKLGFDKTQEFELESLHMEIMEPRAASWDIIEEKTNELGVSVADRLKNLQQNQNDQERIQKYLGDFIIQNVIANTKLLLFTDPKMKDFIGIDVCENEVKQAQQKISGLKDQYSIFKLSGKIGDQAIDIVNTIDNLVTPAIKQAMFKIESLQGNISQLYPIQMFEIRKLLEGDLNDD